MSMLNQYFIKQFATKTNQYKTKRFKIVAQITFYFTQHLSLYFTTKCKCSLFIFKTYFLYIINMKFLTKTP